VVREGDFVEISSPLSVDFASQFAQYGGDLGNPRVSDEDSVSAQTARNGDG
jgi:hypothetical protein